MRIPAALLLGMVGSALQVGELEQLAADFWTWRSVGQPITGDDIPRRERPVDFVPDWSAKAVAERRRMLAGFEKRWRGLQSDFWPVETQVHYRLIGSALARARWELEIERGWQRNPLFYFDQNDRGRL
jgi:hypothetical protein